MCVCVCAREKEFPSSTSDVKTWQEPPSVVLHWDSTVPGCVVHSTVAATFNYVANLQWQFMQQISMSLILWHTGEEQWIMQARGNFCSLQIREKRKEMGEGGLEKSWVTREVGLCYQCKHRS